MTAYTGEVVEQGEHSSISGGNAINLEFSVAVSQNFWEYTQKMLNHTTIAFHKCS